MPAVDYAVVRMPQSNTFHLAEPSKINTGLGETNPVCGARLMSGVRVLDGSERTRVSLLPLYRNRNEMHRCPTCDQIARGESGV